MQTNMDAARIMYFGDVNLEIVLGRAKKPCSFVHSRAKRADWMPASCASFVNSGRF
jgi:hypothetical protein